MTAPPAVDPIGDVPTEGEALDDQLALLGRALGNRLRTRIAGAYLRLDQASPRDLAGLLGADLGSVSYHVKYLHTLGLLDLVGLVPRRGVITHKYRMVASLRRALPAAAKALAEDTPNPVTSAGDALADSMSYLVVDFQAPEAIALHRDALTLVGHALSDDVRAQILGYLLQHDSATEMTVAMGLGLPGGVVAGHVRVLATARLIHAADDAAQTRWAATQPTRTALAGFKELLLAHAEAPEPSA